MARIFTSIFHDPKVLIPTFPGLGRGKNHIGEATLPDSNNPLKVEGAAS